MPNVELNAENIKVILQGAVSNKENCGFAAYIVAKNEPILREMIFDEGRIGTSNYKNSVRDAIMDVISDKFLCEGAQYEMAQNAADDQHKFYIINQDDEYRPFSYLDMNLTNIPEFKHDMINEAQGIMFWFRHGDNEFWAYQHLWSIMVPNKGKRNMMSFIKRYEQHDYFVAQTDPLITISNKVDALLIGNGIITSNIDLMQKSFGFQDFIKATAQKTIESIKQKQLVANPNKLTEYIGRGKTSKYAKKMMRIADSKVLDLSKEQLMEKVHTLPRWIGKFDEKDGLIELNTFAHVESLIDLLDERYTRSDVTEQEYDTDVKHVAAPVAVR